jgi:ATP-dependent DNA ligase
MAATQVPRPFHRPGWVYEEKVDGWRVLAYKNATGVRLVSRNGRDLTRRFPELAAAVADLESPTLVLDGEIAVFDRQLVSRFEWLRGRPKDDTATPLLLPLRARQGPAEAAPAGAPQRARGARRGPDALLAQGETAALS